MPDEFEVLEGITETHYPVLDFRWLKLNNGDMILQQKYLTNTGREEWRALPVVEEGKE
jgi:hypothetical protein